MKNHYTISGDGMTATIELKRRNGEIIHCRVDSADLPKLLAFKARWYAQWDKAMRSFYVNCHMYANGKQKTLSIHRFLTDAPEGLHVDHWDHDSLNNRRSNLRLATRSENGMNRKGATCKSKSGHRGISPHRASGKFALQVMINGKQRHIGLFATIDEAIVVRNQFQEYSNG